MSAPSLKSVASLAAERPLKVGEALGVLRDAAKALAAGHAAGHVHGAVCAENIVLDDRGVARLCRDAPTPPSVSPEQRRGEPPDARSDVYALGATITELLCDSGPVPKPVERLLATMTAEDPERRPQSMGEVLLGLEACELMTGHRAFRPGQEAEMVRSRRRSLWLTVLVLGLVVLALALLAALGETPPQRGKPPESYRELLEKRAPVRPKPTTPAKR